MFLQYAVDSYANWLNYTVGDNHCVASFCSVTSGVALKPECSPNVALQISCSDLFWSSQVLFPGVAYKDIS